MAPDSYDHDKISTALTFTSNHHRTKKVLKFETIPGREDNLIFGSNSLIDEKEDYSPAFVSHAEFLPNCIKHSPIKKEWSHTNTTLKFNLRRATA